MTTEARQTPARSSHSGGRRLDGNALPAAGRVIAMTSLSETTALVVASMPTPAHEQFQASIADKQQREARVEWWARLPDDKRSASESEVLLVFLTCASGELGELNRALAYGGSRDQVVLDVSDASQAVLPLARFAAKHLMSLDTDIRRDLVDRLFDVYAQHDGGRHAFAESLNVIRDALRVKLATCEIDRRAPCVAHVEGIWRIDDHAFYLEGWVRTDRSRLRRVAAVTPEGRALDVLDAAFRYPRPDVSEFFGDSPSEKLGFIAYLTLPEPSALPQGWLLEVEAEGARGVEVQMPPVVDDARSVRATVLGDLKLETGPEAKLRSRHIRPALERVQQRLARNVAIDTVDQHGVPSRDPDVSIVVPLYRRVEFLEHQIAQFVHDPELAAADLVYVLDSPEDGAYLRAFATHLFRLYGVPFRLVTLTANGGFSAVNNLGASLARGRLLLLLNSDVLPVEPGWLSRLVAFYDSTPDIGALGPKLLYEDGSIQHAGLYFDRPPGAHVWSNEHFFKGLHRDFPAANVARRVPAVTAACLLIKTQLFHELGGLRGMYVQGDYEDSDLCLRLDEIGLDSWYLPDVELYHLEAQSYPTPEREAASEYNMWLHTHIWNDVLERWTSSNGD
ncbi:MAG: glycosyltransferase [Actinomycetota bacterium]|nr:glycosyltransferase [Actinomycetota bacterium]